MADLLSRLDGLPAGPKHTTRFSPEYVARLLAAYRVRSRPSSSTPSSLSRRVPPLSDLDNEIPLSPGPAPLFEPLSERELEVLRLMAAGLTNQQIAVKLVVAPGTVKAHVYNICGKLGAQNRVHAIARATEMQLL